MKTEQKDRFRSLILNQIPLQQGLKLERSPI